MTNEWDRFKSEYSDSLNNLKPCLKITIYGSYNPPEELTFLQSLRDVLIAEGYTETKLVNDRQASNDDPLDISQQAMIYSDINLLVFTFNGKRLGLVDELSFLTSDRRMVDKIQFSMVFGQTLREESSIPDLSQSRIMHRTIQVKTFETYEELKASIPKYIYLIMRSWAWRYKNIL